jgi:hypothetical protein
MVVMRVDHRNNAIKSVKRDVDAGKVDRLYSAEALLNENEALCRYVKELGEGGKQRFSNYWENMQWEIRESSHVVGKLMKCLESSGGAHHLFTVQPTDLPELCPEVLEFERYTKLWNNFLSLWGKLRLRYAPNSSRQQGGTPILASNKDDNNGLTTGQALLVDPAPMRKPGRKIQFVKVVDGTDEDWDGKEDDNNEGLPYIIAVWRDEDGFIYVTVLVNTVRIKGISSSLEGSGDLPSSLMLFHIEPENFLQFSSVELTVILR